MSLDDPRLRWSREWLPWSTYDTGESDEVVRVFYAHAGVTIPTFPLAEIDVVEGVDLVSITLIQRTLRGCYPDGTAAAIRTAPRLMSGRHRG